MEDAHLIGTRYPDATDYVVKKFSLEVTHRYFTSITQVLQKTPKWKLSAEQLRAIWASVAFYNYVPIYVSNSSRVRPTAKHFMLGREPLLEVVKQLEPHAILVTGFELWNNVMLGQGLPWGTEGQQRIGSVRAARIKHPSAGFNSDQWRPTVEELIEGARADKAAAEALL